MVIVVVSFDWWRKPEYPEKTTVLSQVTGKLHDLVDIFVVEFYNS
jgi:hypothetical protein